MNRLYDYIRNPSPKTALYVGYEYELLSQLTGAIEFYSEATYSEDKNVQFEALLRMGLCYQALGGRNLTTENIYLQALALMPDKRVIYFVLSRYYESLKDWHKAYSYACQGIEKYEEGLLFDVAGYYASTSLEFQKAVSAWWINKPEESRELMYRLYQYSHEYKTLAFNNLRNIGYPEKVFQYQGTGPLLIDPLYKRYTNIERNYAQSAQDLFALAVSKGKFKGTYLEIGSGDPIRFNNTYLLESKFAWSGVSIDSNFYLVSKFNYYRKNKAICQNALEVDYSSLGLPRDLDYLQVDCEPPNISFDILKKVLKAGFRPKSITFEHDAYLHGNEIKEASRSLLKGKGYRLLVGDVKFDHAQSNYEDWWVHPSVELPEYLRVTENILGIKYFLKN